jgi:hypothetical protein
MERRLAENLLNYRAWVIHHSANVYVMLLYFLFYGPYALISFKAPVFHVYSVK